MILSSVCWNDSCKKSAEQDRSERVAETKVGSTVDEDTNSRDGDSSVQILDIVGLKHLDVDIDQLVELPLTIIEADPEGIELTRLQAM